MVHRRALLEGAEFANRMGDTVSSNLYLATANKISESLELHWSSDKGFLISALHSSRPGRSGLDSSIILGALHADAPYGGVQKTFEIDDDRILATIPKIVEHFNQHFPINWVKMNQQGYILGPALGRYPEDIFDGQGSSRGMFYAF